MELGKERDKEKFKQKKVIRQRRNAMKRQRMKASGLEGKRFRWKQREGQIEKMKGQ